MIMQAIVIRVDRDSLLVFDPVTQQTVLVNTDRAGRFRRGDLVCISYSGVMTRSIPPQITAIKISKIHRFRPGRNRC